MESWNIHINQVNALFDNINQRPIAYMPMYKYITGSTVAAVMLSQLMYWFKSKRKIYKTDSELMNETMLGPSELKTAKKIIKDLPFIAVTREGVPAKTYYSLDVNEWLKAVSKADESYRQTSLVDSTKLDGSNRPNLMGRIDQTITENTTETTTRDIYEVASDEAGQNNLFQTAQEYKETPPPTPAPSSQGVKRFKQPTIDEIAEHIKDKRPHLSDNIAMMEAEKIWYFYDARGWSMGKNKMKNWKSAVSGWISRDTSGVFDEAKKKKRLL